MMSHFLARLTGAPFFRGSIARRSPALLLILIALGSGCVSLDPDRANSPHFRDGRYRNIDPDDELADKGLSSVLYWKLFGEVDPPAPGSGPADDQAPAVTKRTTKDLLAPPGTVRIVWLGHSTVWIAGNRDGKPFHLICDPVFGSILSRGRLGPLPIDAKDLPPVHAIAVSHPHLDHMDFDSLRELQTLNPDATLYLPSGTRAFAEDEGLKNLRLLEWWESESFASGDRIHYLPAHHWSRMGINDFMQSHWLSYAFEIDGRFIFFAGDTGFSSHFQKIAERFPAGFDAALMPIGAFKPRWFMKHAHIDPPEAVRASDLLKARKILPVHWGTFNLGDDRPREPASYLKRVLRDAGESERGYIWQPGAHFDLQG
jgi:L-ascorbate metabolism protein UlaG (beta-lactamase superfamily)